MSQADPMAVIVNFQTEDRYKSLPLYYGILASFVGKSVTHPLDIIRVNIQANAIEFVSAKQTVRQMMKFSGLRGFYYAFPTTVLKNFIQDSLWLYIYHKYKKDSDSRERIAMVFEAALLFGLVSPFMKISITMQSDLVKQYKRNYRNTVQGLQSMYSIGGLPYLYQGWELQSLVGVFITFGNFIFYDKVYKFLKETFSETPKYKTKFVASTISSTIVYGVFTPFYMLRNVVMSARHGRYKSIQSAYKDVKRVHGYKGFTFGLLTTLVRMIPLTMVVTLVYEIMLYFSK